MILQPYDEACYTMPSCQAAMMRRFLCMPFLGLKLSLVSLVFQKSIPTLTKFNLLTILSKSAAKGAIEQ